MLEEEPEVGGPAQWLGVHLNRLAIRLPLPHLNFFGLASQGVRLLLLSTHGQVLKDSAAPTVAVKIQSHEVPAITSWRVTGRNTAMLMRCSSTVSQPIVTPSSISNPVFESPLASPPIEHATPCMV
jgi:hypothetical protein